MSLPFCPLCGEGDWGRSPKGLSAVRCRGCLLEGYPAQVKAIAEQAAKARAWERIASTLDTFMSGSAEKTTVNFDKVLREERARGGLT